MKSFLATFFSVFYLAFASGASVQVHRCMQEVLVSLKGAPDCGKCGTTKKDCCKDSVKLVKLEKHQAADSQSLDFASHLQALPPQIFGFEVKLFPTGQKTPAKANAPPDIYRLSRVILFENLRI